LKQASFIGVAIHSTLGVTNNRVSPLYETMGQIAEDQVGQAATHAKENIFIE
jgi:hypothetical protein